MLPKTPRIYEFLFFRPLFAKMLRVVAILRFLYNRPVPIEEGSDTTNLRVGIGHDTHRLGPGGPLKLGGMEIPYDRTLIGHSDADVLLHAVTDALLGAASLGDIGQLFPDTDEANRDRDSSEMVLVALQRVIASGFSVVNVDCIVFAEQPKLGPFFNSLRDRMAELLEISPEAVGIKAKTGEGVGPIGKGEAMSAQCVVLLEGK